MVEEEAGAFGWPPAGAPLLRGGGRWPHSASTGSSSSVSAVSFGFVATAILISMFLVMAIFEKLLLRPGSPVTPPPPPPPPLPNPGRRRGMDLESQAGFTGKLGYPSPKMTVYASGVSVLMPGDDVPTFIAHPAPVPPPHPLKPGSCSHHQHNSTS